MQTQNNFARRPKLRLDDKSVYADVDAVAFITTFTDWRKPALGDARAARIVVDALLERACVNSVRLWAYCVMPDLLHFAISPGPSCDVIRYVREVKSVSARLIGGGTLWRPSFQDHMHRRHEDLAAHLRFLVDAPVRAGLVTRSEDWSFAAVLAEGRAQLPSAAATATAPTPTA
jgi:putative transposase